MKKFVVLICMLLLGASSVKAADVNLSLCEYSDEYIAWLNLSSEEKANTIMPSMCKQESESGLVGSRNSYSMEKFTLQDSYILGVRNQGASDDCWAFSTLAAIESNLLKNNIKTDYLSVAHLELMTQKSLYTPSYTTFNRNFNSGGKLEYTGAYVLNYWGPINESELPFATITNLMNQTTTINQIDIINKKASVDVDDIFYLNNSTGACSDTSIETIKQYLVNHGALAASIYFDMNNTNYLKGSYYYYNGSNIPNHAVTIVGWDDTVELTSFATNATRKGAWIVKNSYGTSVGDNGYFYVSYDDINICTNIVGFYNADLDVSDEVYYYDDLGTNVTLTSKSDTSYIANTFTKKNSSTEKIDKITFATGKEGINYTVYYASNASLKNYEEIARGTTSHAGFMSVVPSKDIYVTDKYSVIVKFETNGEKEIVIPVAMKGASASSPYRNFEVTSGVSFMSTDGKSWLDVGDKLKVQASIRVYTSIEKSETTPEVDDTSKVNNDATVNLTNPNNDIEGVVLGDTVTPTDTGVDVENPQTGMISGVSIILALLLIGTIIYFKKKNKIFKI